jgi:hypothetical protein
MGKGKEIRKWQNIQTGEHKKGRSGGESDAISVALPVSGVIYAHATAVSDNTGNRTMTVAITDEDSISLYSLAAIPENATTVTRLTAGTEIYVPAGCNVTLTPSDDPGEGGMTCTVTFYGI